MNTFKKITLTSAVAFALFAFNACGEDSNSTSASGENGSSHMSSSTPIEDLDESSSSINGDTSSVTPGSSSSVILSDSEGSSSSVKGSDTADASSSSVIPDPDRESSSSSVKSSSSSAKSSSSVNSSSSVKSSSSSSAKSSSSVASSSSEYVPFDHSKTLGSIGQEGVYKTFTDSRNGRSYYYMEFKGVNKQGDSATVTAMAENLNIGEMVAGDKDQKDDSKIERYCYDNDTTNCDEYGGLYQWAEMMKLPSECNTKSCADQIEPDHQGICPNGWRLLTYDDFVVILNSNGNIDGIKGVRSTFGFGGYNTTGYSLVGAGLRRPTGEFKDCLGKETYWYYPGEILVDGEMFVLGSNTSYRDNSIYGPSNFNYTKLEGRSVRCVKVE